MSFPPAFLDELRLRLPLSEIVGKRMRLVRAGREYKGCCPFHKEKTPSFYVNDEKQFFHCFGCGAHGDIIGFTMRHDHLSFPEAVETLAAQAGLAVPQDTPMERESSTRKNCLIQF
jgi:DNA primase